MRIANLAGRLVLIQENGAVDVHGASDGLFDTDPQRVYRRWGEFVDWAANYSGHFASVSFEQSELGPPAPYPSQIIAVGLNYTDHAAEVNLEAPTSLPPIFTKFASSLTGPVTAVRLPDGNVDWEVELAVVLGARAYEVAEHDALNYVAGYTVAQDLSERVRQMAGPTPQFGLAKSFPGFTPTGPWLVTPDEVDNASALNIRTALNGKVMQDSNTRNLVYPVSRIISELSQIVTLHPGDLILTGTPAGVGFAQNPPRFLGPGDQLVSDIEHIGELRQNFTSGLSEAIPPQATSLRR